MRWLFVLYLAGCTLALTQGFSGSFTTIGDGGPVTLTLQQDASGAVRGTLSGNGSSFALEGMLDEEDSRVAYGTVQTPGGVLAFEATLEADGLSLVLIGVTEAGELDTSDASRLVFTRAARPTAAANPLGGAPLTHDPLAGTFSDGALTVTLTGSGGRYGGEIHFGGQRYPLTAMGSPAALTGTFESGGSSFEFSASLQGDTLAFLSGGSSYALARQTGAAAPGASPATAPAPSSPVLAQGQYATLSQDDALAFIEALEFSLQQAGYPYTFGEADKQQLLTALAQAYPTASREEQLILARAREIWREIQANWASASEDDRRAFILAVFTLAFGEEVVQQATGQGSGGGGACGNFEDCASRYADHETWQDAQNAQSCWASAGCGGYDADSDTFYDTTGEPY